VNRQITLAARPQGFPQESDFALVESEIPKPGPGEVLVRSHWLSLDPHPVLSVFWVSFLSLPAAMLLPAVGAAAGLAGSLLSLGKRHTRSVTRIA